MAPSESRIDPHGVKLGDAGFQAQIYGAAWNVAVSSYKEHLALPRRIPQRSQAKGLPYINPSSGRSGRTSMTIALAILDHTSRGSSLARHA